MVVYHQVKHRLQAPTLTRKFDSHWIQCGADGRADEWVKTIFSVTKHHNIVASFFRNITTLCCAKSRRFESCRVTSPLGMGLSARVEFRYERCLRENKMQIKTLSETS